jgi:hypothetical protein
MAKYLINSNDIEVEEVTGTDNIKLNFTNVFNDIISNLTGKPYDNVDLNDITTTGIYYMKTGNSNMPSQVSAYMYLFVMSAGGTDIIQMGINVSGTPKFYVRPRVSSMGTTVWKEWTEIGG